MVTIRATMGFDLRRTSRNRAVYVIDNSSAPNNTTAINPPNAFSLAKRTSLNHSQANHGAPGLVKEKTSRKGTHPWAIIHSPVRMCQPVSQSPSSVLVPSMRPNSHREIRAGDRHAVATPGDLLLHIRAERMDLCFELATHITSRLGDALDSADEVHGFRYFDDRDLIGFVDGTENPVGDEAVQATVIGAEDPAYAGGSYVVVQKYLHDLDRWNALPTEQQEQIIGRTKLDDIELAEDEIGR